MRKIDPSQAKTETHRKRCPNGYHKDENGVCRRIEELEGEHPDLRHRTPESYERGKREHEKEQTEGKAPKVGEVLDSNSKIARDIRSAFTTSNDAGEREKARKARQDLMEYLRNHDNVPPLTKAKSFVMKYDAERKEYVRAERMEEGAYAFDGHTSTKNAYTTKDGNYTQERLAFHARILDSIINGYTNRKGEKVPPMSKPPEGTKPRMVVLCGGSGSGKSTITPTVKEKHGWDDFQSVDPDAIMTEFFPEWDELSKQNVLQSAYLAHDEASDIAKMVTKYLITNGYNVIVDGTFSKPKKADELFGYIEDSGIDYESSLIAIDVDEAVSVKSCQDRFVNTGRLVPESVAKASNRGAFDVSRDMNILSRFDTVDAYYRDGDNITEVATKDTKDGDIIVRNKEHWKTKKAKDIRKSGFAEIAGDYGLDFDGTDILRYRGNMDMAFRVTGGSGSYGLEPVSMNEATDCFMREYNLNYQSYAESPRDVMDRMRTTLHDCMERDFKSVAKARATKFKVDFSNATFSSFGTDGCTVSGFAVTAERYGMDASIYGVPVGEIGYWIDDSELRQRIIDKYAPKYPEHSDEEYYGEDGMYSDELEAKFRQEADDWERAMDDFEASLDSVQTTVDDIRMPSVTLKCKADGVGAWDYDDSVDCKPKLHMVINVPGGGTESSWEKCEGIFYPSQDVIDFMCAYVDEEEEIEKMKKEGKPTVQEILSGGEYVGGITDPDGDVVQYRMGGKTYSIYLDDTFGDSVPSDEEILASAVSVGCDGESRQEADPVDKSKTKKAHRFQIYQFDGDQLRNDEDTREVWRNALMGWDYFAEKYPDEKPWDKYSQTYEYDDDDENLEEVFHRFNVDRPKDFRGYSLSVGDIVVRDGQAYMVDAFGFTPVDFVHKSKVSKDGDGGTRYGITDAQVSRIYDVVSGGFRYDGSTYDIGDLVSISEGLLAHWKKLESMPTGQLGMFINEIISSLENAVRYINYAWDSELEIDLDDEDGWTYIRRSKDKIDPSNPESIRKGMMRKCGCGGKMEKEDESSEEPTQEAPQQTAEDDAVPDTSDEAKPVESKDEQEEDVEKSVPMLKDPGQMFKACYEYQEGRKLQGLYSDEISKVCGGADPQAVIGYHMKNGAIQRIRCSDGYIYRFNGQNMRRL